MVVAFIGSNIYKQTAKLVIRLWEEITKLVVDDNADVFLFTNEGDFDYYCWAIVSQLQMHHPKIRRVHLVGERKAKKHRMEGIRKSFEKSYLHDLSHDAGILAEFVRNDIMVAMCDVLVTYCDTTDKLTPKIMNKAEKAVTNAQDMCKRVINLFEE